MHNLFLDFKSSKLAQVSSEAFRLGHEMESEGVSKRTGGAGWSVMNLLRAGIMAGLGV